MKLFVDLKNGTMLIVPNVGTPSINAMPSVSPSVFAEPQNTWSLTEGLIGWLNANNIPNDGTLTGFEVRD